jgi:hypothetical protein
MQPARYLSERSMTLSRDESNSNPAERIEQRERLRNEQPLAAATFPFDDLLRRRFTSFRPIYLPTAGRIAEFRFELLPTG